MMIFSIAVMLDGAKSMPDLSVGRSQSLKNENPTPYMPLAGEGKKKKGFFSFLKKEKKFTVVRRNKYVFFKIQLKLDPFVRSKGSNETP